MQKTFFCHAGSPRLTPDDVELLIEGKAWMRVPFGEIMPHKLSPATRRIYQEAQERGWLEMPRRIPSLQNAWFAYCEAHDHPYVYTRRAGRQTEVHMDLISFEGTRPLPGLQKAVDELCRRLSVRKSWFAGHFTKVFLAPESAPEMAAALVRFALSARDKLRAEE